MFCTTKIYCQNIYLVLDNKPNANIVVLDKANKHLNGVAKELENYIFESTKAKLKIVNCINSNVYNIIIATQYKVMDDDGFIIMTSGKNVVISGKSDYGTEYGVYDFLEKYVGVKWLMPTELWTEVPIAKNLSVEKISVENNPKFLSRSFFNINMENHNAQLAEWGRHNRLRNRIDFHHNLINLFDSDIIKKSHPSFLPVVKGIKYVPSNKKDYKWQPNFKAQGLDTYAAKEIIKYFNLNPGKHSYSLGVNDTDAFDDSNTAGKKNYVEKENFSDAYYSWVNRTVRIVNKSIPNKKFGLLAYNSVAEPPTFKLEKNVVPFLTYERLLWLDPSLRQKDIEFSTRWGNSASEFGWYDYVYGSIYLVPRVYFSHYQDYLKMAYRLNVRYYVGEYYPNWIEGPKGWIMTKLLWDPNQNLDSLLNEWYVSAVGTASASHLKKFYEIWEEVWTRDMPNSSWWKKKGGTMLRFNDQSYVNDISFDKIQRADKLLKLVYTSAVTKKQKERAKDLIEMWEFSKMNYLYFRQKDSSLLKILTQEQKAINAKIVTKKDIDHKIEKLKKHPLYMTIINYYTIPHRVKY